ncbi:MAG: hypothetical protein M0004_14560 [Actinomycetota bacterium]|nr:hypothetical protein [Actinomycetota bacterium]
MTGRTFIKLAALSAFAAGAAVVVAAPSPSAGATRPAGERPAFSAMQHSLETQLARRQVQLARRQVQLVHLSADLTAATSLTAANAALLRGRLAAETAAINALAAKAPNDRSIAQLKAERRAMIRQSRVYAVMTPQVFQVIEAASASVQLAGLQAQQSALATAVGALIGQPGAATASRHYRDFVARLQVAARATAEVDTTVLAQVPEDFPRDTHVFVAAGRRLLAAEVSLARADYDATVINLASGGYQGA